MSFEINEMKKALISGIRVDIALISGEIITDVQVFSNIFNEGFVGYYKDGVINMKNASLVDNLSLRSHNE